MMEKIINSYINKLTKNDIIYFASSNNIKLNETEIDEAANEYLNNKDIVKKKIY